MESEKVYLIYEVEDNPYDTSRLIGCAMTKEKAEEICDDLRRDYEKKANSKVYDADAKKFDDWLWENDLTKMPTIRTLWPSISVLTQSMQKRL